MAEEKERSEGLGISGFTLGVLGIVFAFFSPIASLVLAIIGIIFCWKQNKKSKTKLSKTGLILNIIGLILSILLILLTVFWFAKIVPSLTNTAGTGGIA